MSVWGSVPGNEESGTYCVFFFLGTREHFEEIGTLLNRRERFPPYKKGLQTC